MLIRCDSSFKIGTGHVARCLNFSQYISGPNIEIKFVVRDLRGNVNHLIREKQFDCIVLSEPSAQDLEMDEFVRILDTEKPDWVLVDHYGLGTEWEHATKNHGAKVFVIDDLFRKHVCDILLDQNYHMDHLALLNGSYSMTKVFLGPQYALLGQQFRDQKPRPTINDHVQSALVFFGGIDSKNQTQRFLNLVPDLPSDIKFDVVVGSNHPKLPEIKNQTKNISNIELHVQTKEMAKLMSKQDLYIGSGGSVSLERAYMGIPGLCMSVAENQIEVSKSLDELGSHIYLGSSENITDEFLIEQIRLLISDTETRRQLHQASLDLGVGSKLIDVKSALIG